jgi:hypothetical protein
MRYVTPVKLLLRRDRDHQVSATNKHGASNRLIVETVVDERVVMADLYTLGVAFLIDLPLGSHRRLEPARLSILVPPDSD